MSSFEEGYCSFQEYKAGIEDRVSEEELCVGGLYVIMFVLDVNSEYPAAKYPSRVNKVDAGREIGHGVEFTILGDDFEPECDFTATFRDGYWLPGHSNPISIDEASVISGYFKEESLEGDIIDQELQDMLTLETEWQGVHDGKQLVH